MAARAAEAGTRSLSAEKQWGAKRDSPDPGRMSQRGIGDRQATLDRLMSQVRGNVRGFQPTRFAKWKCRRGDGAAE